MSAKHAIPLIYAGNRAVFDGMVISLLGASRNTSRPLEVYLLTMELCEQNEKFVPITEAQRAYLEELCREANAESRVTLIDVGEVYRATMLHSPNAATGYTPYSFLRLYADILPQIPNRAIYLDTDTLPMGDLGELFDIDLCGAELAAVRDRYGCHFFGINYVNSGVLLLDLARIRQTGLFQKVLRDCAARKIFLPDQTALNRRAVKKKLLSRRFNEQKEARPDTVIRHFSMTIRWLPFRTQNVKPWQVDRVHEILHTHVHDAVLDEYLARKAEFDKRSL